jgi:hypothetical protein
MREIVVAIVLAVGMALVACSKSERGEAEVSPTSTEARSEPWFWCYPDKIGADGKDEKLGECAADRGDCQERSQSWHKEDLCYRQQVAFCYVEQSAISNAVGATCSPSALTCRMLRGSRNAGECRMRTATEAAVLFGKEK